MIKNLIHSIMLFFGLLIGLTLVMLLLPHKSIEQVIGIIVVSASYLMYIMYLVDHSEKIFS